MVTLRASLGLAVTIGTQLQVLGEVNHFDEASGHTPAIPDSEPDARLCAVPFLGVSDEPVRRSLPLAQSPTS